MLYLCRGGISLKKYIHLLGGLIAILSLLAACQLDKEQLTEEAFIQKLFSSKDGLTLTTEKEKYTASIDEITINIQNESSNPYTYHEDFSLQKNIDGTWYVVPFEEEMEEGDPVVHRLDPGSSTTQALSLRHLKTGLSSGEYRLLKNFYDPSGYYLDEKELELGGRTLAVPFEITN